MIDVISHGRVAFMRTNKPAYRLSGTSAVCLRYGQNEHLEHTELALGDVRERG